MERVAFLIESSGERLGCLLNPETLVVQRAAGVQSRRSLGGELSGAGITDDPLLYTGGGHTQLQFDLLFDVRLAGSSIQSENVRDLTRPLWDLAENSANLPGVAAGSTTRYGQPPLVRFVWGKTWNIPGIVTAVAERLEEFTVDGTPQRSWLRMRMLRVAEPTPSSLEERGGLSAPDTSQLLDQLSAINLPELPEANLNTHQVLGGTGGVVERLDEIAFRFYGLPSLWRVLAALNVIDDPLRMPTGFVVRIPPLPSLSGLVRLL